MVTSEECKANARECAKLGYSASGKQRTILYDMARVWETLAKHAARLEKQQAMDERDETA